MLEALNLRTNCKTFAQAKSILNHLKNIDRFLGDVMHNLGDEVQFDSEKIIARIGTQRAYQIFGEERVNNLFPRRAQVPEVVCSVEELIADLSNDMAQLKDRENMILAMLQTASEVDTASD